MSNALQVIGSLPVRFGWMSDAIYLELLLRSSTVGDKEHLLNTLIWLVGAVVIVLFILFFVTTILFNVEAMSAGWDRRSPAISLAKIGNRKNSLVRPAIMSG
ncbi:hypothetical protein [Phyllobacterium zundukense]|uniref:Uncharacterized protein n=1 Tax=Phyllobacterium zundukense TaxID=1867719 RepID=A0A2N9W0I6_9HYPH|nr:hypothetical protein [Phyllobacterium zundukense]PIO45254.1 hypothetical protein B5P45_08610 [Phyllobacterium zundukense]